MTREAATRSGIACGGGLLLKSFAARKSGVRGK